MNKHVFISYSSEDKKASEKISALLEERDECRQILLTAGAAWTQPEGAPVPEESLDVPLAERDRLREDGADRFRERGVSDVHGTRHQLLAALVAVAILSVFTFVANYGAEYAAETWQRSVCSFLNVLDHFSDFAKGMVDTRSLIFFLSGTGLFLFLAIKVLESRRWR